MAERNTILSCLGQLGLAYPKEAAHHAQHKVIELWVEMLADLDDGILQAATRECIANQDWFPKISELRRMAHKIHAAAHPTPDAHDAWAEVQSEIRRVGHYANRPGYELRFTHPLIEQAAMTLGWEHLCYSENQVSDRAQFIQAYQNRADHAESKRQLLAGTMAYLESQTKLLDS